MSVRRAPACDANGRIADLSVRFRDVCTAAGGYERLAAIVLPVWLAWIS